MKDLLIKTIAKENNFTVIKKLDENTKQYLRKYQLHTNQNPEKYPRKVCVLEI